MRLIENDLNLEDHIYVRRKRLLYSHHGIYAGDRSVIHFKGIEKEKQVHNLNVSNFILINCDRNKG